MKHITSIPTNKIKPDKNQPRKYFDEEKIQGMAETYLNQGIINPIEIDKNNVIITGEYRWRAAKTAGLKEIPCIINEKKLKPHDRLLRQCVENAHHSDMCIMDTARAWKKLIDGYFSLNSVRTKHGHALDQGYTWLAEKIGKNPNTIRDVVKMLDEPKFVKKELERIKNNYTLFRDANRAPKKFQNRLKHLIIDKGLNQRVVGNIAIALTSHPEMAPQIFSLVDIASNVEKVIEKNKKMLTITHKTLDVVQLVIKIEKSMNMFEKQIGSLQKEIFPLLNDNAKKRILMSLGHIEKLIQKILK